MHMAIRDRRPATGDERHAHYDVAPQAVVPDVPARSPDRPPDTAAAMPALVDRTGRSQSAARASWGMQLAYVSQIDQRITELAARWLEPAARFAIFVIYFWFGLLKLLGLSPATPLARALTEHTIGMQYFSMSYNTLAAYECIIGILFLIPAITRVATMLLVIHLAIVSSPLILVANVAWTGTLVPTLEGQYIIKNLAILALVIAITAQRQLSRNRQ
jgi:hypothetical protein